MRILEIYALIFAAAIASVIIFFPAPLRADETVRFDCSSGQQNLNIRVDDQEKVKWKENSQIEFSIVFDKPSTVQGRLSPFKSCFIFCSQKKKVGHNSAKKGNKIKVKPKYYGEYNYTIYCNNGTKIDPMIQIPRASGPPTPHSKP